MATTARRRTSRRRGMMRRAADSGDYTTQLEAVRDLISSQLDSGIVKPRDMAALTKRYLDVCKELNEIKAKKEQKDPALRALHVPMIAVREADNGKGAHTQS